MKDPCLTIFHGEGGYPGESEKAKAVLEVGKQYRVVGGSMGQSHCRIEIEGKGSFNSVLFDIDIHKCPAIRNGYFHFAKL